MGPFSIYDESVQATIEGWIEATKEVLVELYIPHSSGSGTCYFISSFTQFKELVERAHPGAIFFILRQPQLTIRGIVDDGFIERAMEVIPDGIYYAIAKPAVYPEEVTFLEGGHTRIELKRDLKKYQGNLVHVGKEPPFPGKYWIKNEDPDCIVAFKKNRTPIIEYWKKLFS